MATDDLAFIDDIIAPPTAGSPASVKQVAEGGTNTLDLSFIDEVTAPQGTAVPTATAPGAAPTAPEVDPREIDPTTTGYAPTAQNLDDVVTLMADEGLDAFNLGATIGSLTSNDLKDIEGVIRKQLPQAKFRTDDAGERIVRLPNGKEFALNKKGMSSQDTLSFGMNLMMELPAAAANRYLTGVFGVGVTDWMRQVVNKELGGGEIELTRSVEAMGIEGIARGVTDFAGNIGRDVKPDASNILKQGKELGIEVKTSDINPPISTLGKQRLVSGERFPAGGGPTQQQIRDIDRNVKELETEADDFLVQLEANDVPSYDIAITDAVQQGYKELRNNAGELRNDAIRWVESSYPTAQGGAFDPINTGRTDVATTPGSEVIPVPEGAILPDPAISPLGSEPRGPSRITPDGTIPIPVDTTSMANRFSQIMNTEMKIGGRTAPTNAMNYIASWLDDMEGLAFRDAVALRSRLKTRIAAKKQAALGPTPGKAKEDLRILQSFEREVDRTFDAHVLQHGGPEARTAWDASNRQFATILSISNKTGIRKVINNGRMEPELVMKLLRGGKTTELNNLARSLTPAGKKTVRLGLVHEFIKKATSIGEQNVDALAKDLFQNPAYRQFFDTDKSWDAVQGLARIIKVTEGTRGISQGTGELIGATAAARGWMQPLISNLSALTTTQMGLRAFYNSPLVAHYMAAMGKSHSLVKTRGIAQRLVQISRAALQAEAMLMELGFDITEEDVTKLMKNILEGTGTAVKDFAYQTDSSKEKK